MATDLPVVEGTTTEFATEAITSDIADFIYARYGKYLTICDPNVRRRTGWQITCGNYVGILPLPDGGRILMQPKMSVGNFFKMLATAYRINMHAFEGRANWTSSDELFEALLLVLAKLVQRRAQIGFYREYDRRTEDLGFVRGRLAISRMLRHPVSTRPTCTFSEHTSDIADNQIPAWALHVGRRSALCTKRSRMSVERSFRAVSGAVMVQPVNAHQCVGRNYTRLNSDYAVLHALSRFVIENSGHSHGPGGWETVPFAVNTANLFEQFVAEWLRTHLPAQLGLRSQDSFRLAEQGGTGRIDIVLFEQATGRTIQVLDTKYKYADVSSPENIHQAVAYAVAKSCTNAVLVYPTRQAHTGGKVFDHGIRVTTAAFAIDGDMEIAGLRFLADLGLSLESAK